MLLSIGVRLIQQFAGTFQQRGRYLAAAGNPSQLRFAGLPVQLDDSCERPSPALPFFHGKMGVCHCGQLWQMGHAEYLLVPGHLSQLFRHLLGRAAGNAGIHLVEYQRGNGLLPRQHVFQGQHDPG